MLQSLEQKSKLNINVICNLTPHFSIINFRMSYYILLSEESFPQNVTLLNNFPNFKDMLEM
jgi:hypothetical protein